MRLTPPPRTKFSGTRVLVALAVGLLVGAAMAWFLYVIITHTPADVQDNRIRAFLIIVICCGGLTGSVIETTRQLQASSTDPAYHHHWWSRDRSTGNQNQRKRS